MGSVWHTGRWTHQEGLLSTEGDLCLTCGLCCDGSLFWAVPVAAEEDAPVALDAEGWLRQPCVCLDRETKACRIYAERPDACRAFDCRVLQTVQAGVRTRASAEAEIAAMRAVLGDLDRLLPGEAPSVYRRAAEWIAKHQARFESPAFQRRHRELLRALSAYEAALARFHVARKA